MSRFTTDKQLLVPESFYVPIAELRLTEDIKNRMKYVQYKLKLDKCVHCIHCQWSIATIRSYWGYVTDEFLVRSCFREHKGGIQIKVINRVINKCKHSIISTLDNKVGNNLYDVLKSIKVVKKYMPLQKSEAWERHPAVSMREWKKDETKRLTFNDEGKDITVQDDLRYLYLVTQNKEIMELWIAPNSPIAIGLSPHVPLKDKTFDITKTVGKTRSETRYNCVEVTKA